MASYKYSQWLTKDESEAFDQTHNPGNYAPFAGIYRCTGCGREIGTAENHVLPPQNHHAHAPQQGPILWQLAVFAMHQP